MATVQMAKTDSEFIDYEIALQVHRLTISVSGTVPFFVRKVVEKALSNTHVVFPSL